MSKGLRISDQADMVLENERLRLRKDGQKTSKQLLTEQAILEKYGPKDEKKLN